MTDMQKMERGDLVLRGAKCLPGLISQDGVGAIGTVVVIAEVHMGPGEPPKRVRWHLPADVAERMAPKMAEHAVEAQEMARRRQSGLS